MKLAVLLFGISIEDNYIRPCSNGIPMNIDYKISIDNYKDYKNIIKLCHNYKCLKIQIKVLQV